MSTQPIRGSGSETTGRTSLPDTNTGIPDVTNPRVGRIEWRPENHPMVLLVGIRHSRPHAGKAICNISTNTLRGTAVRIMRASRIGNARTMTGGSGSACC